MSTWQRVKDAVSSAQETGMSVQEVRLGAEIWDAVVREIATDTGFSFGMLEQFFWNSIKFLRSANGGSACVYIEGVHTHRWAA